MHMAEGSNSVAGPLPAVTVPSFLGKLRCPQPSDFSRKRRVSVNPQDYVETSIMLQYNKH